MSIENQTGCLRCTASRMPSSSTRLTCSMVSMPARMAALIPSAPWACPAMRLIGDRAQFLLRKLLLPGRGVAREDTPRRAGFDDFRAELALAADLIFQLVGRIAD